MINYKTRNPELGTANRPPQSSKQVEHNGVWGTVCDNEFTMSDAEVLFPSLLPSLPDSLSDSILPSLP